MDNPIPGVIVEDGAGIAVLFLAGYIALFLFLRFLVVKHGMSWNIFMEGFLVFLLADRFWALLSDECYRLTMEPDAYRKVWLMQVGVLLVLILLGLVILYKRKGKKERGTFLLFAGMMILGMAGYQTGRNFLFGWWSL